MPISDKRLYINVRARNSVFSGKVLLTPEVARIRMEELDASIAGVDLQLAERRYNDEEWESVEDYEDWRQSAEDAREYYCIEYSRIERMTADIEEDARQRRLGLEGCSPHIARILEPLAERLEAKMRGFATLYEEIDLAEPTVDAKRARVRKAALAHIQRSVSSEIKDVTARCNELSVARVVKKNLLREPELLSERISRDIAAIDILLQDYVVLFKSEARSLREALLKQYALSGQHPTQRVEELVKKLPK